MSSATVTSAAPTALCTTSAEPAPDPAHLTLSGLTLLPVDRGGSHQTLPLELGEEPTLSRLVIMGLPLDTPLSELPTYVARIAAGMTTVRTDSSSGAITGRFVSVSWLVWLLNFYLRDVGLVLTEPTPESAQYALRRIPPVVEPVAGPTCPLADVCTLVPSGTPAG